MQVERRNQRQSERLRSQSRAPTNVAALAYVKLLDASCYHALSFDERLCLVYSVTRAGLSLVPKVRQSYLDELEVRDASPPYVEAI